MSKVLEDARQQDVKSNLADLIRHMRHPVKNGLLTIAGHEDGDIPELTAGFLLGGAQIEDAEIPNSH